MIRFAAAAFVASLMATAAFAQTTPGTPPAVAPGAMTPSSAASSAATGTRNAATGAAKRAAAPMMAGQYDNEAAAKAHCPTDTVVWGNASSKAYHLTGTKYYGKTKHGSYMCQKDAMTNGFHAAGTSTAKAAKAAPAAKTN
jgi:hypothetical protein